MSVTILAAEFSILCFEILGGNATYMIDFHLIICPGPCDIAKETLGFMEYC